MNVTFKGYDCVAQFSYYMEGGKAISLVGAPDSKYPYEPIAKATVYLPDVTPYLIDKQVIIKDYSENIGMFEALVEAGIIEDVNKESDIVFSFEDGSTTAIGTLTKEARSMWDV